MYLRRHRMGIIAAMACAAIFACSFALYHLPLAAVAYPSALCLMVGAGVMGAGIRAERRRLKSLQLIRGLIDLTERGLPEPESALEEEYQRMLEQIREDQLAQANLQQRRYDDMMAYYTLWAHQIKTPIAAMKLQLQNEDTALSRTLSSDLFRIEQYVEMVLMFLRLDADSTDYVIREYDLEAIVRQAVKKFAGEFITRKIRLDFRPLNARVVTDEKWLSFVIEQVLSNALKYTPQGGCVSVFMELPMTLCVRDTGIGIAAEDLPRVFEQGYTGRNGRGDKQATGIGLYLCRRVMKNLGHGIAACSPNGEGTTIRMNLLQNVGRHE